MTNKQKGFTLTELMLSMAFISFMLLFLMTAVIHLMRTYNKGISMREINQSGRQFADDFSRTAKYASLSDIKTDLARNRICLNGVTYAWNINDPTATVPSPALTNGYLAPDTGQKFSMVRVIDSGGTLCSTVGVNVINKANATEILPVGLNVKNVSFTQSAADPRLLSLSFVFSTGGYNAPDPAATASGFACKPGGDGAYCAFADFDVTVYARN